MFASRIPLVGEGALVLIRQAHSSPTSALLFSCSWLARSDGVSAGIGSQIVTESSPR